jgi:hypothetical protein
MLAFAMIEHTNRVEFSTLVLLRDSITDIDLGGFTDVFLIW